MKHKLVVSPEAESDIEEAFEWYEDRDEGLGRDFVLEARISIKKYLSTHFPIRSLAVIRGEYY